MMMGSLVSLSQKQLSTLAHRKDSEAMLGKSQQQEATQ